MFVSHVNLLLKNNITVIISTKCINGRESTIVRLKLKPVGIIYETQNVWPACMKSFCNDNITFTCENDIMFKTKIKFRKPKIKNVYPLEITDIMLNLKFHTEP